MKAKLGTANFGLTVGGTTLYVADDTNTPGCTIWPGRSEARKRLHIRESFRRQTPANDESCVVLPGGAVYRSTDVVRGSILREHGGIDARYRLHNVGMLRVTRRQVLEAKDTAAG